MAEFASKKRIFSIILLVLAVLMLVLGQTVLDAKLRANKMAFAVYWMGCFVVTGLAAIVAMMDFFSLQRRARNEQRRMIENVFAEPADKNEKPPRP